MIHTEKVFINKQRYFRVQMNESQFNLPYKVLGGRPVAFLDISGKYQLVETCAAMLVEQLVEKKVTFDTIVNPVTKSNALAHAIAHHWVEKTGQPLTQTVVARKVGPDMALDAPVVTYKSVTSDQEKALTLTEDDLLYLKDKRVLIVDDVYGSGGTFTALRELLAKVGAKVSYSAVIAVEQGATIPNDLAYLFTLPTD